MAGVHDVISEYIDIIDSNVSDPNSARNSKGLKWVYDDIPLASLSSSNYPRISVISTTATSEPHSLCGNQQRVNVRVEVQIRVRRTKWNSQTPQQFLDDLTLSVIGALRSEASRLQLNNNVGVFNSKLEAENTIYDDDLVIKQLVYNNTMVR